MVDESENILGSPPLRACVLIAFKDRPQSLLACLDSLLLQLSGEAQLLLIDDGSAVDIADHPAFEPYLANPHIHRIRQPENLGVSASRNTGIKWCLDHDFDLVVMIDSDCLARPGHIATHVALHGEHKDAAVIGGGIRGTGTTLWATLDGMMTWFHCIPCTPERVVKAPYCLPTANLSIKIRMLELGDGFFDATLRTGEDTAFSRRVRDAGHHLVFSPGPEIAHADRNSLGAFIRHQYEFGRHHYVLGHMDFGLADLCFKVPYRVLFATAFLFGFPAYSVLGCSLNFLPWLRHDKRRLVYWPLLQLVWLIKAVAVMEAACNPDAAFRRDM